MAETFRRHREHFKGCSNVFTDFSRLTNLANSAAHLVKFFFIPFQTYFAEMTFVVARLP